MTVPCYVFGYSLPSTLYSLAKRCQPLDFFGEKRYLSSFFDKLKIVENGFVAARYLALATPF